MKNRLNYIMVLMLVSVIYSCVPQRKMEEEQAKRKNCEKDLAALQISNQECETKLNESTKNLTDNKKRITELLKDTADLGTSYRMSTSKYEKLNQINEQL